jgi:hypothetical protein
VQAGILEDRPGDSGVRSALLTDPQLTERQKQVLIEIYESFRKESQKSPTAEVVAIMREHPAPSEAAAPAGTAGTTDTVVTDTVVTDTAGPAGQPEGDGPSGADGSSGADDSSASV